MTKTNSGLIKYAKAQIGLPYWWGTFGQTASAALHTAKKKQYPSYYTASDFRSQYGKRVHDCIGLIKGYLWSESPTAAPIYNAGQDKSAAGMYAASKIKGKIGTFDNVPGRLIYKGSTPAKINHVGVYIGGGMLIEAKGHAYGVVMGPFKPSEWQFWGQCPFIQADTEKAGNEAETQEYKAGKTMVMNGIDVSDVQYKNGLDLPAFYEKHKDRIGFYIIKCSRAAESVNDSFKAWADFLKAKGASWGAYMFLNNDREKVGGVVEADYFCDQMAPYIGAAALFVDYEGDDMGFAAGEEYLLACLNRIRERTGVTPIVYTQQSRVGKLGKIHAAGFPLWVAKYGKNPKRTELSKTETISAAEIAPYTKPLILQYSSETYLDGYKGKLDANIFYGGPEEWKALTTGKARASIAATVPELKQGSTGKAVRVWQTIIGATPDGHFGPKTDAATRAWQKNRGLTSDGVVGPKTWTAALNTLE